MAVTDAPRKLTADIISVSQKNLVRTNPHVKALFFPLYNLFLTIVPVIRLSSEVCGRTCRPAILNRKEASDKQQ